MNSFEPLQIQIKEACKKLEAEGSRPNDYVTTIFDPYFISQLFEDHFNRALKESGMISRVHYNYNGLTVKVILA